MKTTIGANLSARYNLQGDRFWFRDGTGEIKVKLNGSGGARNYRLASGQGVDFTPGRFDSVEIYNLESVSQTVEFEVQEKEVFDRRLIGTVNVQQLANSVCDDVADISVAAAGTSTIAADGDRVKLVVYADKDNTDYLRVGPNAASGRGYPLAPGGSYTFTTTAAIQVYGGAAGGDYGYIEEKSA